MVRYIYIQTRTVIYSMILHMQRNHAKSMEDTVVYLRTIFVAYRGKERERDS